MLCPQCEQPMDTVDTRRRKSGHRYRMKRCRRCGLRQATVEVWSGEYDALRAKAERLRKLDAALDAARGEL